MARNSQLNDIGLVLQMALWISQCRGQWLHKLVRRQQAYGVEESL